MNIPNMLLAAAIAIAPLAAKGQARIVLKARTLMHEMRATPSPLNGALVDDRKVSFQWPLPDRVNVSDNPLDGFAKQITPADKASLRYRVRYSQDSTFRQAVDKEVIWPMYNPDNDLKQGRWYWQYGYVDGGKVRWSPTLSFTVGDNGHKFCPPALPVLLRGLPSSHPRIMTTKQTWDALISNSKGRPERSWYINEADRVLRTPMKDVGDIRTDKVKDMENQQQVKAYLTRESRRIIDKEEANCTALIGAYLLTKDTRYAREATRRAIAMINWNRDPNVKGDFNSSTLLSLCTMAYDSFYDVLTADERQQLLSAIREKAGEFYADYSNHLENHIADNHVWQMTLRILTMAAFATYGELPEAATWADYCYNVWVARMPGLNKDGAWHNGDSYFTVNTRTLIELPALYSRLSGFDFFSDPWYRNNIMYTIFQQPPFSKSGGNGSSHQNVLQPNAVRVGYLDALARLTGDTYAADFVRVTLAQKPDYLRKAFLAKPGDLSWFRLTCDKPLPKGKGLNGLPSGYVFPESGLASFMTDWSNWRTNAWWSFRSSPYGSTSHALANQNAFNTFYGGQSLFYSSGHHTSFIDRHAIYCHRGTRAHNTILANGKGQRIGTEGYGWMPRWYVGEKIGYVLGDASNAYGPVVSPLWQERARLSEVELSPKTGWDTKNHVTTYRRHIVNMGKTGLIFIYDELEADSAITWSYLLHSVLKPLGVDEARDYVHIEATNDYGASDAYLFAPTKLTTDVTDQFFYPAVNWLKADAKGTFKPYPNHWHFTATSPASQCYHFATVIDTHALKDKVRAPKVKKGGKDCELTVGSWRVAFRLSPEGKGMFHLTDTSTGAEIMYKGEETTVKEDGRTSVLTDQLPQLEI